MLELKDFEAAADRLKNVIHNIPLSTSCTFSAMTGAEVYLKYENQQKTGSFKVRGAYNKIMKRFAESPYFRRGHSIAKRTGIGKNRL